MSNFDEIQELVWDLSGDVDYISDYLSKVYPGVSVMIVTKDPISLPPIVEEVVGIVQDLFHPRKLLKRYNQLKSGLVFSYLLSSFWLLIHLCLKSPEKQ